MENHGVLAQTKYYAPLYEWKSPNNRFCAVFSALSLIHEVDMSCALNIRFLPGVFTKKGLLITIGLLMLLSAGCYSPISGTVVDAVTGKPIEGAVVMVEWTKTHGIGNHWTESYKVAESVTDKDGKFTLPGCYSPFVNEPDVTVYKKGYVAWSSRWIFPGRRNRTDFKWGDSVFMLEQFKEGYSYIDHSDFITTSINSSINFEAKKSIYDAFSWEDQRASKERDQKASKPR